MADWTTISSLSTAGGTLVLALATFASVRSANRAARTAERALEAGLRPVIVSSRLEDPTEKIMWVDRHWANVTGGHAHVAMADDVIYLAMSVRNVGSGIAVLHGWLPSVREPSASDTRPQPEDFRRQTRDIYVPAGDIGFWQGAVREADDPVRDALRDAVEGRHAIGIDVLYGDHEGGQRTISRFALLPIRESEWLTSVARHWRVDGQDPR
jgi:hypothetical protein